MPLTADNISDCRRMVEALSKVDDPYDVSQRLAAYVAARIPSEQVKELDAEALRQIGMERSRKAYLRDMGKAQAEIGLDKALSRFREAHEKRTAHRKQYAEN